MEIHRKIEIKEWYNCFLTQSYLDYFEEARRFSYEYYSDTIDRISNTNFYTITPEFFYQEAQWCVLTSGFNSKIISNLFPKLSIIFQPLTDFVGGKIENVNSIDITMDAMNIFGNKRKIKAIIDIAFILQDNIKKFGWKIYKEMELNSPEKLTKLPFIGNITCFHLARNCGHLDVIKPDLHLTRLAQAFNFNSPLEMCKEIKKQKHYDLPLGIIDLCLFYFASTFGTK